MWDFDYLKKGSDSKNWEGVTVSTYLRDTDGGIYWLWWVRVSDNCQVSGEGYIEQQLKVEVVAKMVVWTGFVVLEVMNIVACQVNVTV